MSEQDHAGEIARKQAQIADLTREIDEHRRALGERPGISPFAPEVFPELPVVPGVRFAAVAAGVRYTTGRLDVMLAELGEGSVMAGTFTRSETRSAPVLWCQERIVAMAGQPGERMAVLVNAGNSNAFTGGAGVQAVETAVSSCADVLDMPKGNVFMARKVTIEYTKIWVYKVLPLKRNPFNIKSYMSHLWTTLQHFSMS